MQDYATQQLNAKLKAEEDYEKSLPKCALCGEPIYEYVFEINGETLCENCMNDNHRRPVEDYLD